MRRERPGNGMLALRPERVAAVATRSRNGEGRLPDCAIADGKGKDLDIHGAVFKNTGGSPSRPGGSPDKATPVTLPVSFDTGPFRTQGGFGMKPGD